MVLILLQVATKRLEITVWTGHWSHCQFTARRARPSRNSVTL